MPFLHFCSENSKNANCAYVIKEMGKPSFSLLIISKNLFFVIFFAMEEIVKV
jgi:hypothetical protein